MEEMNESQIEGLRKLVLKAIHAPTRQARESAAHQVVGYVARLAGVDLTAENDIAHRRRAQERA